MSKYQKEKKREKYFLHYSSKMNKSSNITTAVNFYPI